MIKSPEISVIIPVYNANKYLNECISSILNQSFKEFELILVDDGSKDNSLKICEEFAAVDDRIIIIKKENGGVSSARNRGIEKARGHYVSFCDADDTYDIDYLEFLYRITLKKDYDIVMGADRMIYPNGKEIFHFNTGFKGELSSQKAIQLLFEGKIGSGVWTKLIKRSFIIDKNLRFREDKKINEDRFFVFEALLNTNKIYYHDIVKYNYYIRDNSATNISFDSKFYDEVILAYEMYDIIRDIQLQLLPSAKRNLINANLHVLHKLLKDDRKHAVNLDFEKRIRRNLNDLDISNVKMGFRRRLELLFIKRLYCIYKIGVRFYNFIWR